MQRKLLALGLASLCWSAVLAGCELTRHEQQVKVNETIHEEDEATSSSAVGTVESKPPKGFFSNTRMSGAWSSEARQIERNLGVP